jgi:hypothetical protein
LSILLQIAKAMSRLDNKVDLLYAELGPLANQIWKDARSIQFDKALLHELERTASHPFKSMLAETGIAVSDRRTKELLQRGDTHPNVTAMQETRELLPNIGGQGRIREARKRFIEQKETDVVGPNVDKILGARVKAEVEEVRAMMQRALRSGQDLEDMRIELEVGLAAQVDKMVRQKYEDLEGEEVGKMKSLAERVREIEAGALKQQEKIEEHQKRIEEKLNESRANFEGYEKRMQGLLQKANDSMAEAYLELDKKFEGIMQTRRSDSMKMLESLKQKQKNFVDGTYTKVKEESEKITELVQGSIGELDEVHKELRSLAEQAQKSIIEVNKTVARVGNSIPKARSRIRNG